MSNAKDDDDRTVLRTSGVPTQPQPRTAGEGPQAASSAGDSGNALPPGTQLGEFELNSVLGEGGFGIVYVAWDKSLQRKVAIKEYMPTSLAARLGQTQVQVRSERHRETFELGLRSFINEARLLAQFDHPSLVKVYRFWEAHGTAYMVMPLYEGITLKDQLRQMNQAGQHPDEAWLMRLLAPLTEALSVIHHENCFHRDIAPDNVILLAGSQRPLLLDFGAARRVIGDMTQALTVILKPGYAPVEQYAEVPEMKQGAWTDVYALAASVHYAVMGRTPPTSVSRLLNDTYVPLTQSAAGRFSERFLQTMDDALRVRPNERTASMAELRSALGLPPLASSGADTAPDTLSSSFGVESDRVFTLPSQGRDAPVAPSVRASPSKTGPAAAGARRGMLFGGLGVAALVGLGAAYVMWGKPAGTDTSATAKPTPSDSTAKAAATSNTANTAGATAPTAEVATASASPPAAAPSPAAAPPAPAAARSFEIRDEINRLMAGQTAGFTVRAAAKKSSLVIGRDRLQFEVSSSRDGFVQVLVLGPDGKLLLLFPNAQASDNRIKAGQTLNLPQASWPLEVSEPAGREEFVVIVSAQPRDYSELSTQRDYIFLSLPTGAAGTQALNRWTRSTPLLLGTLKACPSVDCEAYGAAGFGVDIRH